MSTTGTCQNINHSSLTSWSGLGNGNDSDNSYVQTGVYSLDTNFGDELVCKGFDFDIPAAALSIQSIEVYVEARNTAPASAPPNCNVGLNTWLNDPNDNTASAFSQVFNNEFTQTDAVYSKLHANWGESWTPGLINHDDFGVRFRPGYGDFCGDFPWSHTITMFLDEISITVTYTINLPPTAPTLSAPASGATAVSTTPTFSMSTTDTEADYTRYEIVVYEATCTTPVRTIDQTSSQTGWSGQNTQVGTAYTDGSTATHTYQQPQLAPNTTYCWRARAIDPGGRNIWGSYSSTRLFTTNIDPGAPTLSTPTPAQMVMTTTPQFTFSATDTESNYLRYEIVVYEATCTTPVRTIDQTSSQTGWSGQNTQVNTAYTSGSTATHTYQSPPLPTNTTYCWKARAIDPGGSNTWGAYSGTRTFYINLTPSAPSLILPASGQSGVPVNPELRLYSIDDDNDYLRYRVYIYQSNCSTLVRTIDQTSSQTGWSGQNQQSSTAYSSSQTALHSYQDPPLSLNTTYCWQAQAIDPGGTNTWGGLSPTGLFTTTVLVDPGNKVIQGSVDIRGGTIIGQ